MNTKPLVLKQFDNPHSLKSFLKISDSYEPVQQ